jgi:putative tryptophan/tyrosine transport system substrate-binding protein
LQLAWCEALGQAMRRREFIALVGGATTWSLAARAQQPLIGALITGTLTGQSERIAALREGLKESGFVEGQNVAIAYGSAEGHDDQLPTLAADLIERKIAVLLGLGTAAALAAKRSTTTVPVVFLTGGEPVELGLVASLNQPGGNVTGVSFLVNKLVAKRLELLTELTPAATTLGMLIDPANPNSEADTRDAQAAAASLGRTLIVVKAGTRDDLEEAFATLAQQQIAALFLAPNVNFLNWTNDIVALAIRYKIAASSSAYEFVAAGGLMSYGGSPTDAFRQVGVYAGRVLKGAKPADLPVIQSSKFEFALNVKTAKALGLTVPEKLLVAADRVIE